MFLAGVVRLYRCRPGWGRERSFIMDPSLKSNNWRENTQGNWEGQEDKEDADGGMRSSNSRFERRVRPLAAGRSEIR